MSSKLLRSCTILAGLFAVAAVLPSSLGAQSSRTADSSATPRQPSTAAMPAPVAAAQLALMGGPRAAPAGVTRLELPSPLGLAAQRSEGGAHIGAGPNLALMGTGAAAVIVGLMIGGSGGTAVAVGGGALGLVGLYRYIR